MERKRAAWWILLLPKKESDFKGLFFISFTSFLFTSPTLKPLLNLVGRGNVRKLSCHFCFHTKANFHPCHRLEPNDLQKHSNNMEYIIYTLCATLFFLIWNECTWSQDGKFIFCLQNERRRDIFFFIQWNNNGQDKVKINDQTATKI